MDALGSSSVEERERLKLHVERCASCRELSNELHGTVAALSRSSAAPQRPARWLQGRTRVGERTIHSRPRRRAAAGLLVVLGVAAAVSVLVSTLWAQPRSGTATRVVALAGAGGARASVVLVAEPWGTSLTIRESGPSTPGTYLVSMAASGGRWWAAGSYRSKGAEPISATMACAVAITSISEIRVTDPAGQVVLASASGVSSSW
jgi:hypothetical protein